MVFAGNVIAAFWNGLMLHVSRHNIGFDDALDNAHLKDAKVIDVYLERLRFAFWLASGVVQTGHYDGLIVGKDKRSGS